MKTFILLSAFVMASLLQLPAAHGAGRKQYVAPVVEPTPEPASSPQPEPSPSAGPWHILPILVPTPRISVTEVHGAQSQQEYAMVQEGIVLANKMLDNYCFQEWVTAATYTENNNLSQQEIFELIKTHPVTLEVELYTGTWWENHKTKTIGYENDPFDGVVHMNRYFVNRSSDLADGKPVGYMVADNLIHEAEGHSQGFHHYQVYATSVPYGLNYAFEGCSQAQQQQMPGAHAFKPPGIRIAIRHRKPKV